MSVNLQLPKFLEDLGRRRVKPRVIVFWASLFFYIPLSHALKNSSQSKELAQELCVEKIANLSRERIELDLVDRQNWVKFNVLPTVLATGAGALSGSKSAINENEVMKKSEKIWNRINRFLSRIELNTRRRADAEQELKLRKLEAKGLKADGKGREADKVMKKANARYQAVIQRADAKDQLIDRDYETLRKSKDYPGAKAFLERHRLFPGYRKNGRLNFAEVKKVTSQKSSPYLRSMGRGLGLGLATQIVVEQGKGLVLESDCQTGPLNGKEAQETLKYIEASLVKGCQLSLDSARRLQDIPVRDLEEICQNNNGAHFLNALETALKKHREQFKSEERISQISELSDQSCVKESGVYLFKFKNGAEQIHTLSFREKEKNEWMLMGSVQAHDQESNSHLPEVSYETKIKSEAPSGESVISSALETDLLKFRNNQQRGFLKAFKAYLSSGNRADKQAELRRQIGEGVHYGYMFRNHPLGIENYCDSLRQQPAKNKSQERDKPSSAPDGAR